MASFEVSFLAPPTGVRTRPQTFSFVLSRFDPRRSQDPGQIVEDSPARWVNLPTGADFQVAAHPAAVVIRPWRRWALFQLDLQNRGHLPASFQMRLLRAATKEGLRDAAQAEPVGSIGQPLEARRSGTLFCLLPPPVPKGSYYTTAVGTARVAQQIDHALSLREPILVRYIPWLRRGRDWAFLLGALVCLVWLAFGVPIPQTPQVRLKLGNASSGTLATLKPALIVREGNRESDPIRGVTDPKDPSTVVFDLPRRIIGVRFPFLGSGGNRGGLRFVVLPSREAQDQLKEQYDIAYLWPNADSGSELFEMEARQRPAGFSWRIEKTAYLRPAPGIRLALNIGGLGVARRENGAEQMEVTLYLDGMKQKETWTLEVPEGPGVVAQPLSLPVQDERPHSVKVEARTRPYQVTATGKAEVYKRAEAFPVSLTFPTEPPKVVLEIPAQDAMVEIEIYDPPDAASPAKQFASTSGAGGFIPWPVRKEGQAVRIAVLAQDGSGRRKESTLQLETAAKKVKVDLKLDPLAPGILPPPGDGMVPGGVEGDTHTETGGPIESPPLRGGR
jgi:hypothetical protein